MNWWDFILTEKGKKALDDETLDNKLWEILKGIDDSGYDFGFGGGEFKHSLSEYPPKIIEDLLKRGYIEESPSISEMIQSIPDLSVKRVLETYRDVAEGRPVPDRRIDNALDLIYKMNQRVLEEEITDRPEVAEDMNLDIDRTMSRSRSEKVLMLDKIMSYWHHNGPWLAEGVLEDRQATDTTMRVLQSLFEGRGLDPSWESKGKKIEK